MSIVGEPLNDCEYLKLLKLQRDEIMRTIASGDSSVVEYWIRNRRVRRSEVERRLAALRLEIRDMEQRIGLLSGPARNLVRPVRNERCMKGIPNRRPC